MSPSPRMKPAVAALLALFEAMRRTLRELVDSCHGGERPDCPILDDLAAVRAAPRPAKRAVKARPAGKPRSTRR